MSAILDYPHRHPVSVQEFLRMGEAGVFGPEARLELIEGDGSHPMPADMLLVIEVSDSTLAFDSRTKVPLYARAGVPEAWVVDIAERAVHVYRDCAPSGYRTSSTARIGEEVASLALPEARVAVSDLFPK